MTKFPNTEARRAISKEKREKAANIAYDRPHEEHVPNGDEELPKKVMSFTKGLLHNTTTGLIENEDDFQKFVDGICSGDPEIIKQTPLGPNGDWKSDKGQRIKTVRAWESAGAGLAFDLQGPDAQSVTMPPPPALGSDELTAEMAEVYCQAVLRDIPFTEFSSRNEVQNCIDGLNQLPFFTNDFRGGEPDLSSESVFRGFTEGDQVGPYLSQFLLCGNNGRNKKGEPTEFGIKDGLINYGAITIDQQVRQAEQKDYMTEWKEYIDVQNGADFRGQEDYAYRRVRRFITTGRDLATYVHYDALYQAYLNACLILLGHRAEFDKGVPFKGNDTNDRQQGFALFGDPHILTLVTEVATRALKAVRFQKFNIHRRLRPEALAARMQKMTAIESALDQDTNDKLKNMYDALNNAGIFTLLNHGNKLLPMAYCEGSPMHPSYGAGHATVAGACVTILKAFFNHDLYIDISQDGSSMKLVKDKPAVGRALVPSSDGKRLEVIEIGEPMTLNGELNKLAANISIGRNWAGVHYYSDYKESLLMGEKIAIGLLQEQDITYNPAENFHLNLKKFDGTDLVIGVNRNPPAKKTAT